MKRNFGGLKELFDRSFIGLRPHQGLDSIDKITNEMSALLGCNVAETRRQKENCRAAAA